MAKIAENVKFVDDLQQALRESLAVFPDSELKSEQKLTIENIVGRRDVFGQLPIISVTFGLSQIPLNNICVSRLFEISGGAELPPRSKSNRKNSKTRLCF